MRADLRRRLDAAERRIAVVVRHRQEAAVKAMSDEELDAYLDAMCGDLARPSPYDGMTDGELDQVLWRLSAGAARARV